MTPVSYWAWKWLERGRFSEDSMAQKTIKRQIELNAKTGSGFEQVQSKLKQLQDKVESFGKKVSEAGQEIERYSSQVRDWEKESVETYRDYEHNMQIARAIFSENADSVSEVDRMMNELDRKMQQWASETIFHTDDVSEAVAAAARAGWSFEQILTGIPNAMLLAQAGDLDLADAVTYLYTALNATGTGFEKSGALVDEWVKSSTLAALSVQDIGEAINVMGATAGLAGSTGELMAMLDVLAQLGYTGSTAGTLLRNMMLRVVAPTKSAADAFGALGLTQDQLTAIQAEMDALMEEESEGGLELSDALEEIGFSAYDAEGNLKSFLQIWQEINAATAGMTPEKRNAILKSIFPQRAFGGALGMIEAANGELLGYADSIGGAEGAAGRASQIIMDSLYGNIEIILSKWEALQLRAGQTLEPRTSAILEFLGGILDVANNLDEPTFSAMVKGIEALGLVGPGLIATGFAIQLIANPALGIPLLTAAAVAGGAALAEYIAKLAEMKEAANFGGLDLNAEDLLNGLGELEGPFGESTKTLEKWSGAAEQAVSDYIKLSQTFGEKLIKLTLGGSELTQEDLDSLKQLGQDMGSQVILGINSARATDMTFLEQIFTGSGQTLTDEERALYQRLLGGTDEYYSDLELQAYKIGADLQKMLTAAFQDKDLTPEEQTAIQNQIAKYAEILAEIEKGKNEVERYTLLAKASRVSKDTVDDYMAELEARQAADIESINEQYDYYIGNERRKMESGHISKEDYEKYLERVKKERQAYIDRATLFYRKAGREAIDTALLTSDLAPMYEALNAAMEQFDKWWESGALEYTGDGNLNIDWENLSADQLNEMLSFFEQQREYFGNANRGEKMNSLLKDLEKWGLNDEADMLRFFYGTAGEDAVKQAKSLQYWQAPAAEISPEIMAMDVDILGDLGKQTAEAWFGGAQKEADKNDLAASAEMTPAGDKLAGDYLDTVQNKLDANPVTALVQFDDSAMPDWMRNSVVNVNANTGADNWGGGRHLNVNFDSTAQYAEGGFADSPSIFGEAGLEAAIPVSHSDRTAELLNATRQASGFTWGELMGLSTATRASTDLSVSIVYSPTINGGGGDMAGLLQRDKENLALIVRQELHNAQMRQAAAAY